MAAYSSTTKRIKNALVAILSDITYDTGSGAEPAFVSVLDNTQGQFDGYPSLQVLPGQIDTEKAQIAQNDRSAAFSIFMHIEFEKTPTSEAAAFDQMYDLTELILDQLDEGDYDDALNQEDATLGTWIMNATRGDWVVNDSPTGQILTCEVAVTVSYSKNLD